MFDVKVDTRRFDRAVTRTIARLSTEIALSVDHGAKEGAKHARRNHKHKRRTGRLTSRANLYARKLYARPGRAAAEIVNTTPYARFVEYPTRPHVIRPKEGHGLIGPLRRGQSRRDITDIGTHRVALRWFRNGKPVFARKVMHPGTPGFPFMRPGLRVAAESLEGYFYRRSVVRLARIWRTR